MHVILRKHNSSDVRVSNKYAAYSLYADIWSVSESGVTAFKDDKSSIVFNAYYAALLRHCQSLSFRLLT